MSFACYKDRVDLGDTAILYINFNVMYPVTVSELKPDKTGEMKEHIVQTSFGALKVKDLVGKRYGTKVQLSRGYAFLLHPTPELWTRILPHRTQILYATDISMILLQLELKPGSVVVESGTGSGSLSHSFIRTIAPTGHLHTFDFHEKRVEAAHAEFQSHGVADFVTAKHADACKDGFGLEDVADAVFLDLPHPWEAIPHAKRALKRSGGRICSFSPCVEQVQKACAKMRSEGFTEIQTLECLLREFQVRKITQPVYNAERSSKKTGIKPENGAEIKDQPKDGDEIKESNNQAERLSKKRPLEEPDQDATMDEESSKNAPASGTKPEDSAEIKDPPKDGVEIEKASKESGNQADRFSRKRPLEEYDQEVTKGEEETTFLTGIPLLTMPGHTGYLTFATLPAKSKSSPAVK